MTSLQQQLHDISTTHLCDAYPSIRLLNPAIRPILQDVSMIGSAFTVNCEGDLLPVIKALDMAEAGSVLVINTARATRAVAGEIFSTTAKRHGLAGIVIDGFARDVDAVRRLGLPFYTRGVCAQAGTKQKAGALQVPIVCGDVTVHPGEWVIGDDSGVVVLSDAELHDILLLAENIKRQEETALQKINAGEAVVDMFNFTEHYENVVMGNKDSEFKWTV